MKIKVHWIVDGIAELDANNQEEAEKWVNEVLTQILKDNPIFSEKSRKIAFTNMKHSTVGFILQTGDVFTNEKIDLTNFKVSKGIELRLFGYNVYSYPIAFEYEYHIANGTDDGKHYFKILFDFVE